VDAVGGGAGTRLEGAVIVPVSSAAKAASSDVPSRGSPMGAVPVGRMVTERPSTRMDSVRSGAGRSARRGGDTPWGAVAVEAAGGVGTGRGAALSTGRTTAAGTVGTPSMPTVDLGGDSAGGEGGGVEVAAFMSTPACAAAKPSAHDRRPATSVAEPEAVTGGVVASLSSPYPYRASISASNACSTDRSSPRGAAPATVPAWPLAAVAPLLPGGSAEAGEALELDRLTCSCGRCGGAGGRLSVESTLPVPAPPASPMPLMEEADDARTYRGGGGGGTL